MYQTMRFQSVTLSILLCQQAKVHGGADALRGRAGEAAR